MALPTNAVVAIEVSLSPAVGVGACGSPVKTGEANGAFNALVSSTYFFVEECKSAVGAPGSVTGLFMITLVVVIRT
jgi:hypothetical protein